MRYRVKFPLDDPLPQVISIKYNGDLICSGSITERRFHYTNINLGINWSLGDNASEKLEPVQTTTYRTTQRVTTPRTTKAYSTSSETSRQTTTSSDFILLLEPSIAKFEESANYQNTAKIPQYQDPDEHEQDDEDLSHEQDDDVVCGIPKVPNFSSRIVGGTTSPRGQFPWIVAYFDVNKKGIPQFLCGGSLVSRKIQALYCLNLFSIIVFFIDHHVVSAAHCIQEKSSTKIRQASNAILYIGKSNLETDQERGHQKVGAKKIIMHPEYDAFESLYDADISIFVLNRKISYSEFIRPICLWNLNGYLDDIVNEYGTIVGWGTDEDVR